MSCLDYPRIHFSGKFSTDVCTANNDDMNAYPKGEIDPKYYPLVDPVKTTLNDNIAKMSRDEARNWFGSLAKGGHAPNAGWNYYGDHIVEFLDAKVTSVDLGAGDCGAKSTLIGSSVSLPRNPKMVDVDPTGSANTQIFFGAFALGDSTAGINFDSVSSRSGRIGYTRWIGGRNINASGFTAAAATWQFGIPNGKELTFPGAEADPALAKLQQEAANAKGILVQFCVYYAQPLISTADLIAEFAKGKRTHNPAVGHLVGTIGVWNEDDRETLPNGRLLMPKTNKKNKATQYLNPAAAKLQDDEKTISLNLITTFPEYDASPGSNPVAMTIPEAPTKENIRKPVEKADKFPPLKKVSFGKLSLCLDVNGALQHLGDINGYDCYEAYVKSAGILDVAITPTTAADLAKGDLCILAKDGCVLFKESPLVAETDDHAVYLEQGHTQDVTLNVRWRGAIHPGPVSISQKLEPSTYGFNTKYFPVPQGAVTGTFDTKVDADGSVAGTVTAGHNASLGILRCAVTDTTNNASSECEISLRIYPKEDYSNPPASERSWQEVYDICLKYYDYVFPGMGEVLDLADEELVVSQAAAFLYVLDTPFENPQFMPVTRSLPPDRKKLLVDWLRAKTGIASSAAVS